MNLHRLARVVVRIYGLYYVIDFLLRVCNCTRYLDRLRDFLHGVSFSIDSDLLGYLVSLAIYFISGFVLLRFTDVVIDWLQVDQPTPLIARDPATAIDGTALTGFAIVFIRLNGWSLEIQAVEHLTYLPAYLRNAFMLRAPPAEMMQFIWYLVSMILLVGSGIVLLVKATHLAGFLAMDATEGMPAPPAPPSPPSPPSPPPPPPAAPVHAA